MSQFINKIKLAFIHVPKTGGSFIEKNLQRLARKYNENRTFGNHYNMNQYNKKINYTFFGVVRHPYDRLYSAYNMFVRQKWKLFKNTYNKLNKPKDFISFVTNLYQLYNNHKLPWQDCSNEELDKVCSSSSEFAVHVCPQYIYFMNRKNEIGIDNILKYESLDTDFNQFINNNYKDNKSVYAFLQNNISKNIRIKPTYNIPKKYPELINMIYEIYEKDFDYFNYTK